MAGTKDVTFTRKDIDSLIQKLGEFATHLNKEEWDLLLAIFAVAADQAEVGTDLTKGTFPGIGVKGKGEMIDDPEGKKARELREQLRRAYRPGKPPVPHPLPERVTP
jgi:hypothetical protein